MGNARFSGKSIVFRGESGTFPKSEKSEKWKVGSESGPSDFVRFTKLPEGGGSVSRKNNFFWPILEIIFENPKFPNFTF